MPPVGNKDVTLPWLGIFVKNLTMLELSSTGDPSPEAKDLHLGKTYRQS